ncbi:MAG: aminoacyl-histidine dipeptidase [Bacteroidales bacterium]
MGILSQLQPQPIWDLFERICEVPRPSGKEEKIIAMLINFAETHKLEWKKDDVGNVLISKPATAGKENVAPVVLQSHIDMVCEKNSDKLHDFENDPITPVINDAWVYADNTTLGADNGLGMAAQMAVLLADNISHGAIECLFTVTEETGLVGAKEIKADFFKSHRLINLDSEDDHEIFMGCAGGIDTTAVFAYTKEAPRPGSFALVLSVTGLKGGHSGGDIHLERGNANKVLARYLWNMKEKFPISLADFDGGSLRNAIPREARAVITCQNEHKELLVAEFNHYASELENEYSFSDSGIKLSISSTELPEFLVDGNTTTNLLNALVACPHGVIAMSTRMENLVETSTNLAAVKFIEGNKIQITTSQRSEIESRKMYVRNMVISIFRMAGAEVANSDGYCGWTPNPDSELLKVTRSTYEHLFGETPDVHAIHAGLECGLFSAKYPALDMVSFGPNIRDAHSPKEKAEIKSVGKFWEMLVGVLENLR